MPGRATTADAKRDVMERILAAWLMRPELRLGQLIDNAMGPDAELFYVEDVFFAEMVEGKR